MHMYMCACMSLYIVGTTADLKMHEYKINNIQGGCGITFKFLHEGLSILDSSVA